MLLRIYLLYLVMSLTSSWLGVQGQPGLPPPPCYNVNSTIFDFTRVVEMEQTNFSYFHEDTLFNNYIIVPYSFVNHHLYLDPTTKQRYRKDCISIQFGHIDDRSFDMQFYCNGRPYQKVRVIRTEDEGIEYIYQPGGLNICGMNYTAVFKLDNGHIDSDYRTYLTIGSCPLNLDNPDTYRFPTRAFSIVMSEHFHHIVKFLMRRNIRLSTRTLITWKGCDCSQFGQAYTCQVQAPTVKTKLEEVNNYADDKNPPDTNKEMHKRTAEDYPWRGDDFSLFEVICFIAAGIFLFVNAMVITMRLYRSSRLPRPEPMPETIEVFTLEGPPHERREDEGNLEQVEILETLV